MRAEPILDEQQIGLALQPDDLEPAAREDAVLDLAAVVIRYQLAPADLAEHLALVGHAGARLREAAHEEVGRPPVYRHGVDIGPNARAVDDGFIVAGDEAGLLADPRNLQRHEMPLEELPRARRVGRLLGARGEARLAQRGAERLVVGQRILLCGDDRPATGAESLKGGQRVVVRPARDLAPGERRVLAAGNFQRPLHRAVPRLMMMVRAGGRSRRNGVAARDRDRRGTAGGAQPPAQPARDDRAGRSRATGRCRCRPASSSGRARRCHGQMSSTP